MKQISITNVAQQCTPPGLGNTAQPTAVAPSKLRTVAILTTRQWACHRHDPVTVPTDIQHDGKHHVTDWGTSCVTRLFFHSRRKSCLYFMRTGHHTTIPFITPNP